MTLPTTIPNVDENVTDLDRAFGSTKWLPAWDDIPVAFREAETVDNKWVELFTRLFYGHPENPRTVFTSVDDVTEDEAKEVLSRVAAIMASFEPKHQHKHAGCAYLMSLVLADWEVEPEAAPDVQTIV